MRVKNRRRFKCEICKCYISGKECYYNKKRLCSFCFEKIKSKSHRNKIMAEWWNKGLDKE